MYSRMEKQRCGKDRETTRRQERKREQEMLRFPLDVRCVCVPAMLACCPLSLRMGLERVRKRKEPVL